MTAAPRAFSLSARARRAQDALLVSILALVISVAPAIAISLPQPTSFPLPTPNSLPFGLTVGPGGNLYFTESTGERIGRINAEGQIIEFPLPPPYPKQPLMITHGSDGNLWFTESQGNAIGRMTTGTISEFVVDSVRGVSLITSGADGNLWFTGDSSVGRITPFGEVDIFPTLGEPFGIALGPDDNIWFGTNSELAINRVRPDGTLLPFDTVADADPRLLTLGPEGNVWFSENSGEPRPRRLLVESAHAPFRFDSPGPFPCLVTQEGFDFFNFGSSKAGGHGVVTMAVGARYRVLDHLADR